LPRCPPKIQANQKIQLVIRWAFSNFKIQIKNGLTAENPPSSRIVSFIYFSATIIPPTDPLF